MRNAFSSTYNALGHVILQNPSRRSSIHIQTTSFLSNKANAHHGCVFRPWWARGPDHWLVRVHNCRIRCLDGHFIIAHVLRDKEVRAELQSVAFPQVWREVMEVFEHKVHLTMKTQQIKRNFSYHKKNPLVHFEFMLVHFIHIE